MNTTLQEGLELAKGLDAALKGKAINCDVVIGTHLLIWQVLLLQSTQTKLV